MGAECSADRNFSNTPGISPGKKSENDNQLENNNKESKNQFSLNCKSYKDYHNKIEMIKLKMKEILKKVEIQNDYTPIKNSDIIYDRIENSYHFNMDIIRMEKLFEIALLVFQKISSVYGNSTNFPKQELSKIDYNLISRYLAYEIDEEDDSGNITKKIIKRINFFSEEFPFKLSKLEKIIQCKKIFAFGYDIFNRITFYIRPNDESGVPTNLDKFDYIIYMFFIIENLIPTLKDKYNFSEQINITLDFNNCDADTEFIRFIMSYFNSYYPLILGKVNIINFKFDNLKRNLAFKNELGDLDFFRNIIFHNETYKFHIIKDYYPNCFPIDYGGYHNLEGYKIKKDFNMEDFIEYTIAMIIIKAI